MDIEPKMAKIWLSWIGGQRIAYSGEMGLCEALSSKDE